MKINWKFFAALAGGFTLLLLVYLVAFYFNLGVPTESSHWCYDMYGKKRLVAEKITDRKLILVAGSSTLFGLSAQEMENQTGVPTVNLGTHASLRTDYLLAQAKKIARPGDTILLTLEYELFTYGKLNQADADEILVDYIVSRDLDYMRSLSLQDKWHLFMAASTKRLKNGLHNRFWRERSAQELVYDAKYLNAWGDQTRHPASARTLSGENNIRYSRAVLADGLTDRSAGFEIIRSFCEWARTNQVKVLATFPNLCDRPEYHLPPAQHAVEVIKKFYAQQGVPVLGDYTDAILPPDQFFDTMYHLTDEACISRTQRLAKQLAPYLATDVQKK